MTWLFVSAMYKKLVSDAELSVLKLTNFPAIPRGLLNAARVAGWLSWLSLLVCVWISVADNDNDDDDDDTLITTTKI